jgi:hypothetical protein
VPAENVLNYTGVAQIAEAAVHEISKDPKEDVRSNPLSDFVKAITNQISATKGEVC